MRFLDKQFQEVDNSPLIVFRIFFGVLVFAETFGAMLTGWVRRVLEEPEFNFTIIGLEWLQIPKGPYLYIYFSLMAICGIFIAIGYKYKYSAGLFTVLWTFVYWMQKSSYNNHYYLLVLLGALMFILPAHRYASIDVKMSPNLKKLSCPKWCINIFITQLLIVYTFAATHKLYPGWLNGDFISMNFAGKSRTPIIGNLLQEDWLQMVVIYGGILYDGLIIYFLLWRRTRMAAFVIGLIFHLFNSAVFQIGIFPYLMIAMCVFFFERETIRKRFFPSKPIIEEHTFEGGLSKKQKLTKGLLVTYLMIQILVPLRSHVIAENVFYTEEGHRLSWRMMLRYKTGIISFKVVNPKTGDSHQVNLKEYLVPKQIRSMSGKPDMIWQFTQYLDKHYKMNEGFDPEIYIDAMARLNNERPYRLIDPKLDLSAVPWDRFKHSDWILSP